MTRIEKLKYYRKVLGEASDKGSEYLAVARAKLGRTDLFFMLVFLLGRKDVNRDWLYDRCNEVQAAPDDHLDLWAREFYKSTIITYGKTIQDIVCDPEITVGIFSHTRPIAKGFLRQIKREFESNELLKSVYSEVLWESPHKDAPKWNEDDGIVAKRKSNPKESTVEAWGVVDGQPTSRHFSLLVYDDLVTRESVTTPDMIHKTTEALSLSYNLGTSTGRRRFIGTRYHFNDSYGEVIRRGTVIPRIYPATKDGTPDGEPVFMSREELDQKRRDMGNYVYACFGADTKILMGDFTQKNISDVETGDIVIGYTIGTQKGEKGRIVRAPVKCTSHRLRETVRITFESGRIVECTPDHKFFTGRSGRDSHAIYKALGLRYQDLKGAISLYDPRFRGKDSKSAAYLAGLYDGEGSYSSNALTITQSPDHNPEVCERIENTLVELGFDYGIHERPPFRNHNRNAKAGRIYYLRGGRSEMIRFLNIVQPAKAEKIIAGMLKHGSRRRLNGNGMRTNGRDLVGKIEPLGMREVFNIETETGNYIADGYMVKNSQMLQNPRADETQGFQSDWLRYYDNKKSDGSGMNRYILCDPASSKKKESDYTAIGVIGLGTDNNYYMLDLVRDRLNLRERGDAIFSLHRRWRPHGVGYEKYGIQADIEYLQERMEHENYRFQITPVGGQVAKPDRIRSMIPIFEQGRFYLPESMWKTDYQGQLKDLVTAFVEEEYKPFPVGLHDDIFDMLSRITDENLNAVWPKSRQTEDRYSKPKHRRHKTASWMAA